MNKTNTKRSLLMSALALVLCFSMLVGTTFAWFTDSVTSSGNKIQSGTLKIDLELLDKDGNWNSIKEEKTALFNYDKWEPGYTEVKVLKVENEGSLALKWMAKFVSEKQLSKLAEAIDVYVLPSKTVIGYPERDLAGYTKVGTVAEFVNTIETTTTGTLQGMDAQGNKDAAYLGIALKMREDAGNEYQGLDLGGTFDIQILATQFTSEADSFDKNYDLLSAFPFQALIKVEANTAAYEAQIRDANDTKVGSVVIPAGAVDTAAQNIEVNIEETVYNGNFTVGANREKTSFDVTVTGLKENNDIPVKVQLRIEAGKDPDTVQVYHYDTVVPGTSYNPNTGYVTFESTTFSPFSVVYDKESVYVPPVVDEENDLPKATVVESTEYENVDLPWGSYGQWSPTAGLDSQLEAAYTFSCTETLEEAKLNAYANWNCDFYVKLDKDLGANQIFLGGNYGSFGWVGFHNGDMTLEANTEIGLLESVTTNPWSYLDVVQNVRTFICGVGDVDNALSGATFTVMLRLTNPADATDFVNVATINYTFE